MTSRLLQRIRDAITQGEYDVTIHAVEEMAEDGLDILDVESAVLNGESQKRKAMIRAGRDTQLLEKEPTGEYTLAWRAVSKRPAFFS